MVAVKCIHDAKHAHVTDPPKPDTRFICEVNTCQRINCTPFMTISALVCFFFLLFQLFEFIFLSFHSFFFFFLFSIFAFIHLGIKVIYVAIRIFSLQELIDSINFHFQVIEYRNFTVRKNVLISN